MARSVGRQIGLPIVGLAFHLMIHGTELPEPKEQQGACHRTEDDTRDATPGDGIGAIGVIPILEKVDWCHGCVVVGVNVLYWLYRAQLISRSIALWSPQHKHNLQERKKI
ncbi:hypothetical protein BO86DRAFT_392033, partial [Aspergillus japonicus CBS 114.51]